MVTTLTLSDIEDVVKLHKRELNGFLSELGEPFLRKFYKASLKEPIIFTIVKRKDDKVVGFATGAVKTKGLYKRLLLSDKLGFLVILLSYIITHPHKISKMVSTLAYPGFKDDDAELLSITISKNEQRKGLGRELFGDMIREFKKRGIKRFRISVYDRLLSNQFYKKMGCTVDGHFQFLGEKMNYYSFNI